MAACPECGKLMPEPGFGSLSNLVCVECEQRHRDSAKRKQARELRKRLEELEREVE
jgi:DNA-directed RNA polymerase subunit M/transcription elongation factor TFIIS